ncbi:MAG: DUF2541 family protein [Hyphomicrobiaceae bacterium]|nr:DUF2541 family protein [Hyphomicrobiaceae bacterium]
MLRSFKMLLATAIAVLLALPASAQRGPKDWVLLGEQTVGFRVDRDVINVGNGGARFSELRIVAERNDVHLMALRLVYQNGFAEDFRVDKLLRPGTDAMPVDLRGERSFLRQIELTYRARPSFEGRAVVKVYGELRGGFGGGPAMAKPFDVIESQRVDRDDRVVTFDVGRREGRFSALRFRADDGSVRIKSVRIVFGNGENQIVTVEDRLEQGDQTRVIDLAGERRFIRRVDVEAHAGRDSRGGARLTLLGQQGDGRPDDRGPPPQPVREEWVTLGTQKAAMFEADHDTFKVGREAGTFRAIRAYVEKQEVRFYGMTIRYGNGETEDVPLNGVIRPGEYSKAFDLRGRDRFIESITFKYRSKLSFKGSGRVEIQGLKHGPYRDRDDDRGRDRGRDRDRR